MENPTHKLFISIASLWELAIKNSLGKLDMIGEYDRVIDDLTQNQIAILPINFQHTAKVNQLFWHHKDPFDRMIAAQSIVENLPLLSADVIFDGYLQNEKVKRIW